MQSSEPADPAAKVRLQRWNTVSVACGWATEEPAHGLQDPGAGTTRATKRLRNKRSIGTSSQVQKKRFCEQTEAVFWSITSEKRVVSLI